MELDGALSSANPAQPPPSGTLRSAAPPAELATRAPIPALSTSPSEEDLTGKDLEYLLTRLCREGRPRSFANLVTTDWASVHIGIEDVGIRAWYCLRP